MWETDMHYTVKTIIPRYHYAHRSSQDPFPEYMGVIHGQELDFTFGGPLFKERATEFEEEELDFARDVLSYWTDFVKSG